MMTSEDGQELRLAFGFVGLSAALFSALLVFLKAPFTEITLGTWNGGVPMYLVVVMLMIVALVLVRVFMDSLSSESGQRMTIVAAFLGACLAPLWLFLDRLAWVLLPFISAGFVAAMLIWFVYLSTLAHNVLVPLASAAFGLAALLCAFVGLLPLATYVYMIAAGMAMCLSCALSTYLSRRPPRSLLAITAEDSSKRAGAEAKINRWTCASIGASLGFVIGTVYYSGVSESFGATRMTLLFALSTFVATCVLLVVRSAYEFVIEDILKDYFSLVVTAGLLALPFASGTWQVAVYAFLLCIIISQLLIMVTAISEVIRFEQVSPLWFVAEYAFVFAGMTGGLVLAWLGKLSAWDGFGLYIGAAVTILFCSYSQVFTSRGGYPKERVDIESVPLPAAASAETGTKTIAHWHEKVDYIGSQYDLSPRQMEILELLAKGRDVAYIVEKFHISRSTAKTHVYNIYRRLNVHSRQDLIDMIEAVRLEKPTSPLH